MTEDQARDLFRAHCSTGQQASLEAYGERPAIAALMTAQPDALGLLTALKGLSAVAEMTTFSDQYPAECEAALAAIAMAETSDIAWTEGAEIEQRSADYERGWFDRDAQRPWPLSEIAVERRRQVEVEGWTLEHDDAHTKGELAKAAGCYAIGSHTVGWNSPGIGRHSEFRFAWPWQARWWKPKDRRSDLIRAGALIVAEIERLDRKAGAA